MEPGLVSGEEGPINAHSTEGSGAHAAVRIAAPGAAPMLQLNQFSGGFFDESLHRILVGQEVSTEDGVLSMEIEAVVLAQDSSRAAFGRHRVAPHRINFRDDRYR